MAPKRRKSAAADVPVPQSREAAADQLARIGNLRRSIAGTKAEASDQLAAIGRQAENAIAPTQDVLVGLEEGLQIWCEANRQVLTNGGKTKTAKFGTGNILWRHRPPKVRITGMDAVIDRLKSLGLKKFLRAKTEVNRDAMLADPEGARLIEGVAIGSAGEDFIIEPAEIEAGA